MDIKELQNLAAKIGTDLSKFQEKFAEILSVDFCHIRYCHNETDSAGKSLVFEGATLIDEKQISSALNGLVAQVKALKKELKPVVQIDRLWPSLLASNEDEFWQKRCIVIGYSQEISENWVSSKKWPSTNQCIQQQRTSVRYFVLPLSSLIPAEPVEYSQPSFDECLEHIADQHLLANPPVSFISIPVMFGSLHNDEKHFLAAFGVNVGRPIDTQIPAIEAAISLCHSVCPRFVYKFNDPIHHLAEFLKMMAKCDPHDGDWNSALVNILPMAMRPTAWTKEDLERVLKSTASKLWEDYPLDLNAMLLIAAGCHATVHGELGNFVDINFPDQSARIGPPMTLNGQQTVVREFWKALTLLVRHKDNPSKSTIERVELTSDKLLLTFCFSGREIIEHICSGKFDSHDASRVVASLHRSVSLGNRFEVNTSLKGFDGCIFGSGRARLFAYEMNDRFHLGFQKCE